MSSFKDFLVWEATTRDTIDFKKIYVDMADDLIAGLMLSQIVFWHMPNQDGQSKLRVKKDGQLWIAKKHTEWHEECRITDRQAMRAIKILADKDLIITALYRFDGAPTTHIRLNVDAFMESWNSHSQKVFTQSVKSNLHKVSNPIDGKCQIQSTQSVKTLTEITTQTTTEKGEGVARTSGTNGAGEKRSPSFIPQTGDPLLDAATNKFSRRQNGLPTYGRQFDAAEWNLQLSVDKRLPLAKAIADATGKRLLWDAGDERLHNELHQGAITAHRMNYTPEGIRAIVEAWRADWRGKNGGSVAQFLTFLSEQGTAAQAKPKKKKLVAVEGVDM